ncbi:MAG: LuxR C-terminal-related transcriptional regulator [Acidimicrobiia bacterium]
MSRRPVAVAVVGQRAVAIAELIVASASISDQIEWCGVVPLGSPLSDIDVVVLALTGNVEADEFALRQLVATTSAANVVVALAGSDFSTAMVRAARRLGVRSFIDQSLSAQSMIAALMTIADGGAVEPGRRAAAGRDWIGRDAGLSERESQVLVLCAEGLTNREIAETLYINVETVKSHLKNVYSSLGLHNRAQAATYVHRARSTGRMVALDWSHDRSRSDAGAATIGEVSAYSLAVHLGLDEATIAERLALLSLTTSGRDRLGRYSTAVDVSAAAYAERLTARWIEFEQTAPLLHDEGVVRRLVDHQRSYLLELFTATFDVRHCEAMVPDRGDASSAAAATPALPRLIRPSHL